MMIYILIFFITSLLCSKITEENNKKNYTLLFIVIMLLSIIGGLRDFSIGTDVEVYGKRWFELATNSSSFKGYITLIHSSEYGYLLINFIVSRFTSDTNAFLFILQLICNTLVYITLYKHQKKCPLWMSSLAYLSIFYGMTFNIMRQACALSIILYSIIFLEKKQNIKYIIGIIIASLFHSTATIAGVLIFLIYSLSKAKTRKQFIMFTLLTLISCISIFFIKDIIGICYSLGIVNSRIYNYLNLYVKKTISISIIDLSFKIFILLTCIMRYKYIKQSDKINSFLLMCTVIEFILYHTKIFIAYSERFSFYFGYISLIYIPQAFKSLSTKKEDIKIYNILYILIIFSYWYYKYVKMGICEIYPYNSQILGI